VYSGLRLTSQQQLTVNVCVGC